MQHRDVAFVQNAAHHRPHGPTCSMLQVFFSIACVVSAFAMFIKIKLFVRQFRSRREVWPLHPAMTQRRRTLALATDRYICAIATLHG